MERLEVGRLGDVGHIRRGAYEKFGAHDGGPHGAAGDADIHGAEVCELLGRPESDRLVEPRRSSNKVQRPKLAETGEPGQRICVCGKGQVGAESLTPNEPTDLCFAELDEAWDLCG